MNLRVAVNNGETAALQPCDIAGSAHVSEDGQPTARFIYRHAQRNTCTASGPQTLPYATTNTSQTESDTMCNRILEFDRFLWHVLNLDRLPISWPAKG